jgi:hypothetical protein
MEEMKMKKGLIVTGILAVLVLGTAIVLAAPAAGTLWGTVGRTTVLVGNTLELAAQADGNVAPGLAVAANHHALKLDNAILALRAVDTTTMTPDQVEAYAEQMVNMAWALADLRDEAASIGMNDVSATFDTDLQDLVCIMWQQKSLDAAFSARIDIILNAKPPQQLVSTIVNGEWAPVTGGDTNPEIVYAKPPQQEIDGVMIICAKPPQQQIDAANVIYAKPPQQQIDAVYAKPPQQQIDAVYAKPPQQLILNAKPPQQL